MKLSKLKGLTEDDMEMSSDTPEQPDRYEQLRRVNDNFVQTMKDYKDSIWFWQKFSLPEGEGTFTIGIPADAKRTVALYLSPFGSLALLHRWAFAERNHKHRL